MAIAILIWYTGKQGLCTIGLLLSLEGLAKQISSKDPRSLCHCWPRCWVSRFRSTYVKQVFGFGASSVGCSPYSCRTGSTQEVSRTETTAAIFSYTGARRTEGCVRVRQRRLDHGNPPPSLDRCCCFIVTRLAAMPSSAPVFIMILSSTEQFLSSPIPPVSSLQYSQIPK